MLNRLRCLSLAATVSFVALAWNVGYTDDLIAADRVAPDLAAADLVPPDRVAPDLVASDPKHSDPVDSELRLFEHNATDCAGVLPEKAGTAIRSDYGFSRVAPLTVGIHRALSSRDSTYIVETVRLVLPALMRIVGEPQSLDTLLVRVGPGVQYFIRVGERAGMIQMDEIDLHDRDHDGHHAEDPYDGRDNDGDGWIDEDPPNDRSWDNLFIHELTHAIQMEILYDSDCPRWLTEGMAEAARYFVAEAATAEAEKRSFRYRDYARSMSVFDLEDAEAARLLGGWRIPSQRPTGFGTYYTLGSMMLLPILAELGAGRSDPHPLRRLTEALRADLAAGPPFDSFRAIDQAWLTPVDGVLPVSRWMRARSLPNGSPMSRSMLGLRPYFRRTGHNPYGVEIIYTDLGETPMLTPKGALVMTGPAGETFTVLGSALRPLPSLTPGVWLAELEEVYEGLQGIDTLRARTWIFIRASDVRRQHAQDGLNIAFIGRDGRALDVDGIEVNGRVLEKVPGGMVVAPMSGLWPDGALVFRRGEDVLGTVTVPGEFTRVVPIRVGDPTLGGIVAWEPYRPSAGDTLTVWLRQDLMNTSESPVVTLECECAAEPEPVRLEPTSRRGLWQARIPIPLDAGFSSIRFQAGRAVQGYPLRYFDGWERSNGHCFDPVDAELPYVTQVECVAGVVRVTLSEPIATERLELGLAEPESPGDAGLPEWTRVGHPVPSQHDSRRVTWELTPMSSGARFYRVWLDAAHDEPGTLLCSGRIGSSASRPGVIAGQPFPNPSPDGIRWSIELDSASRADFSVFDVLGRRVFGPEPWQLRPGRQEIRWNGVAAAPMPSGVYFLRLDMPGFMVARRVVLVRHRSGGSGL